MILKLYKYKNAGVREYWVVDPQNQSVTVHDFRDEESYNPQKYSFEDQIPVSLTDGACRIDFSQVRRRIERYE